MARAKKAPVVETPAVPVCPYTGRVMELVFDDDLKRPGWRYMGGFDPSIPFLTEEDGRMAFCRREGVDNVMPEPRCAYTGAKVTLYQGRGRLWYAEGAYSPAVPTADKERLVFLASMRDGKQTMREPAKRPRIVVGDVREPRSDPRAGLHTPLDSASENALQAILA